MRTRASAMTFVFLFLSTFLFAHGGRPHVMGTVAAFDGKTITVKKLDGSESSVAVTAETKYVVGKSATTARDVKPGLRVVVHLNAAGKAAEIHLPAK